MTARSELLQSIASITADYRAGEIPAPTPQHVAKWINQFESSVQEPILREVEHVLQKTYFSRATVQDFLNSLLVEEKLTGKDAATFWRDTNFLRIQGGGNSQSEMLAIFDQLLQTRFGFDLSACGQGSTRFLYLDDAIFTGNRVKVDLEKWIENQAPQKASVYIITIAQHTGHYKLKEDLTKTAKAFGKSIDFLFGHYITFENQKIHFDESDILCPSEIPDDPLVKAYVQSLGKNHIALRTAGKESKLGLFTSEAGRHLLEQEFVKAGAKIRQMCRYLGPSKRPLGHIGWKTLGFGSMLVTFRNCPNNAPLVLWVGHPWYPLFPRKTNADTRDSGSVGDD